MEFKYTEDQIALRRAVREWAQSYLAPKAEEIDVNNRFPTETIKALGEQDLMGLAYPEELGGAGYDAISEAIAMEEISAACAACWRGRISPSAAAAMKARFASSPPYC